MSRELCLRILFKVLVFILCEKTGNFLIFFSNIFSIFYKKRTRTYSQNLRHCSLNSKVSNTHPKSQVWDFHDKKDVYVQKIKVKKYVFIFILHNLRDFTSYFQYL